MQVSTLARLKTEIQTLSLSDQLWLMEILLHHIRQKTLPPVRVQMGSLADMAVDPEVQRELQQITLDFLPTEMDGLEAN